MQDDALSAMILSNSSSRLLLETVWDNYGLVSSNSNLNHYISRLRKKLDFFNVLECDIISVPKKGFKFNENVPVILLSQGDGGRSKVTEQTLEGPPGGDEDDRGGHAVDASDDDQTPQGRRADYAIFWAILHRCYHPVIF